MCVGGNFNISGAKTIVEVRITYKISFKEKFSFVDYRKGEND